jgi:PAS domain S-box-containing protein
MNDKTKSIFAIMAIILTLSGLYLFRGIRLYRDTMDKNIARTMDNTLFLMDETVKNSRLMYDMRLNILIRDEKIQESFAGWNRDELYRHTLPFHDAYKAENLFYANLHFHLPSGHSFLRMHKPEEFDDDLSVIRPMIMQVHQTQNPLSGYEIGKHGLFYRVVRPMFFKGEYIGAVELGIMAEEVVDRIENALKVKIARVIKDENLNSPFQEQSRNEIHTQGFSIHPYKNESFFNQVAGAYDFTRESVQQIKVDGRPMAVFTFGNLKNYEDGSIAWLLIAQDISDDITGYRSFLSRSIYLTLVLVILAYAVLYFSFGSYINRIMELNKTLESRVKERTKELEAVTDKLILTHAKLDQIFNTAADGMRLIGIDFKILRVNETFSKLIGADKQLAVNTLCHEHFKGQFCFSPECTLNRILNGEEYIEMDVEKEIPSGEKRSFLLTATPFKSANGEILGVVENFKDITHRKNAARAIEENEQYLKAIMYTVQAGVVITDEKSPLIIDANPYALKLIGSSREKLMKFSIRDHFNLEKPWIDHVLKSESPFEKEDYILTTASGKKLNIRLSIARATHKGRTYLVQSFSDMTDINTSSDDITLAGIEIETLHPSMTKTLYPKTAAEVSGFVQEILTLVFDQKENTAYRHMKSRAFMILEEALINAWKHGNGMSPDKPVTIRFDSRNDFVFEITDQGPGFDYCNPPDPTSAENIQKDSGRGLFILRHFSDHVEWKGTGNHILISLKKMKTLDNRVDMENPATCIGIWGKN